MAGTLTLPLSVARDGGLAQLEQGTGPDIAQSLGVLLATTPGERGALPTYGLPNGLGSGLSVDDVVVAASTWEDRATPADVEIIARDLFAQDVNVRGTTPTQEA